MPCTSPVSMFQPVAGGQLLSYEKGDCRPILICCGQCGHCRLRKALDWCTRMRHEFKMSDHVGCFLTLTYDEDHIPADHGLRYSDVQKFFRYLRRRGLKFRYYCAGEYGHDHGHPFLVPYKGGDLGRPHWHILVFGIDFRQARVLWKRSGAGCDVFQHPLLSEAWPNGSACFSEVTDQSIAYCAKHNFKRITGRDAADFYSRVDTVTGEILRVSPECSRMSLKPGLGFTWLEKFGGSDVYPHDSVLSAGGVEFAIPKAYDKVFKRLLPDEHEEAVYKRYLKSLLTEKDRTPERLAVRAEVLRLRQAEAAKRRGKF